MRKYNYLHDPGHGWFRVKTKELVELGIADKISAHSFVSSSKKSVYLEEDSDATVFFDALYASGVRKEDIKIVDKYSDKPSPIRRLDCYSYNGTTTSQSVPVSDTVTDSSEVEETIEVSIQPSVEQSYGGNEITISAIVICAFFIVISIIS